MTRLPRWSAQGRVFLGPPKSPPWPPHRLPALGLKRAFQQNAFFHDLTVLENMIAVMGEHRPRVSVDCMLTPSPRQPAHAARRRRDAAAVFERFDVASEYHRPAAGLIPYGTQRLLSIALAYGNGAKALLLDEPGAGLGGADMDRLESMLHFR